MSFLYKITHFSESRCITKPTSFFSPFFFTFFTLFHLLFIFPLGNKDNMIRSLNEDLPFFFFPLVLPPLLLPGFSCFHSLGETIHLASNLIALLWLISKSLIFPYPSSFLKSCSEQKFVFCIACASLFPDTKHTFSCLHLSLHCFLIFILVMFFTCFFLLTTSKSVLFFFAHAQMHTHTYQMKHTLSNPT